MASTRKRRRECGKIEVDGFSAVDPGQLCHRSRPRVGEPLFERGGGVFLLFLLCSRSESDESRPCVPTKSRVNTQTQFPYLEICYHFGSHFSVIYIIKFKQKIYKKIKKFFSLYYCKKLIKK
ncbi:MAG: hypothetical protein Q8807_03505 ['Waltheria sp.' little leaf phytoplasma]|nr:hypothetical protein ['Waltheria sp.' little leaf phytoplasma]